MKNIILSELNRMLSHKKNIILFIISIIIFIINAIYIKSMNVGFYDTIVHIPLDSLNFPPFILRENHLYLIFIFCPILFIESFNQESIDGAYRLVMIRGYSKWKFILGKVISCAIVSGVFIMLLFFIGTILGYLLGDKASSTTYFSNDNNFLLTGAFLYNIKFYFLEYLILLCILGISSITGSLMPNSALAYILNIVVCIGLMYVNNTFRFFLVDSKTLFDVLDHKNNTFLLSSTLITIITLLFSILIFKKRDYVN